MSDVFPSTSTSTCVTKEPVCAACGRAFTCGASLAGCWCAEVKLSEIARKQIARLYTGCLCRGCLERFANEQLPGPSVQIGN